MSIAYGSRVGTGSGATSVSSFATGATSASIPAGSLIIVSVSCSNVGDTNNLSSVTDSAGNTYVSGGFTVDGGQNTLTAVWYCANCLALASSSTVTAHLTSALLTSGESWRIAVDYATGIATTSVTDGSQGKNSQVLTTWVTGTGITTTNAADLLWVANGINQGEPSAIVQADCSPTTGWTLQTAIINGGNSGDSLRTAYNIVAATGTYHGGGTCTTGSNGDSAVIVAFKAAAGGGGTVSGSGSMIGNATVASGGVNIEAGADTLESDAVLSGPANLLAGADSVTANATLSGPATLIAGPEPVQANAALSGVANILAGPEAAQGNGVLSGPARLVSGGSLIGNSAVTAPGAILLIGPNGLSGNSALVGGLSRIIAGPEALISNSIILNPAISAGGNFVGNSILSGSGIVVAGGTLQSNSSLSGVAQILAALTVLSSSGVLSGPAILVAGPESLVGNALILSTLLKIPGIILLTDMALALAILSESVPVAILTDTAPIILLGDEYGQ